MATTGFDTLKVSQDLKAAGFNEAQAGAIVRSMAGAFQDGMIATKSDIDKLQASTRADVDNLRTSTNAEFAAVRVEIDNLRASTTADIAGLRASTKGRHRQPQGRGLQGLVDSGGGNRRHPSGHRWIAVCRYPIPGLVLLFDTIRSGNGFQ